MKTVRKRYEVRSKTNRPTSAAVAAVPPAPGRDTAFPETGVVTQRPPYSPSGRSVCEARQSRARQQTPESFSARSDSRRYFTTKQVPVCIAFPYPVSKFRSGSCPRRLPAHRPLSGCGLSAAAPRPIGVLSVPLLQLLRICPEGLRSSPPGTEDRWSLPVAGLRPGGGRAGWHASLGCAQARTPHPRYLCHGIS